MNLKYDENEAEAAFSELPLTLLDLLSNTLVLDYVIPCLSLSSVIALSQTSKPYRCFVQQSPRIFRHVDLSLCRGAYIPPTLTKVDTGGHSWRSQRMDEHLTEDDIYAGPLRGVLSKLSRTVPLSFVHVLVLDGLASVTSDLITEILTDVKYDVWILSVIGCINLNPRKLQQLLCYMCRESRPEGTPRLKGLYFFGAAQRQSNKKTSMSIGSLTITGVTSAIGAQLGSSPVSTQMLSPASTDTWYSPTGRVLSDGFAQRSPWEETLQVCSGIIAFDAVQCNHMHTHMEPYLHHASREYLAEYKPAVLPLATVALGPAGCAGCGQAPEGSPVWGESDVMQFPLLSPPPITGRILDAMRPPPTARGSQKQRLIASCTWCLTNRHCESCHRWWCGTCYDLQPLAKTQQLETFVAISGLDYMPSADELQGRGGKGHSVKVFNNLCVENCLVGEMMTGAGSGGMWG